MKSSSRSNKALVLEAFGPWERGDSRPFFDLVAEDVAWTVIGTTAVSGVYHSKHELIERAFAPLIRRMAGPLTARLVDIAAEGEKVFLRFESHGIAKTGLAYDQTYCFAMKMRSGRVVEIVAYLDTELLARMFA